MGVKYRVSDSAKQTQTDSVNTTYKCPIYLVINETISILNIGLLATLYSHLNIVFTN